MVVQEVAYAGMVGGGGVRSSARGCVAIGIGAIWISLGLPLLELRVVCLAGNALVLADARHADAIGSEGRFKRRGSNECIPLGFFTSQIGIELHLARFLKGDFLRDGFTVVLQDCIHDTDEGGENQKEGKRCCHGPGMLCLAINPIPVCFPSSMGCGVSFHSG